jgi:hypothetical protein
MTSAGVNEIAPLTQSDLRKSAGPCLFFGPLIDRLFEFARLSIAVALSIGSHRRLCGPGSEHAARSYSLFPDLKTGAAFTFRDEWQRARSGVCPTRGSQGEGAPLVEGQYMAGFKAFRDVYEAVARAKFETGSFKASMTIELSDIAQYLSGRQR